MRSEKLYMINDTYYVINYDEEKNYEITKIEDYIIKKCPIVDATKTIAENIEFHKEKIIRELEMADESLYLDIFENELLDVQERFGIYIDVDIVTEFDRDYEGGLVELGSYAQLNYVDSDGRKIGESL